MEVNKRYFPLQGTVRLGNHAFDLGQFGMRNGLRAGLRQEMKHMKDMVIVAGQQSKARLQNARVFIKDTTRLAKEKLINDTIDAARAGDKAITAAKNIIPTRKTMAVDDLGNLFHVPAENKHTLEKLTTNKFNPDGVGVGSGVNFSNAVPSPSSFKNQIKDVLNKHQLTIEDFNKLKLKAVDELTDAEVRIMKEIRDSVPPITNDTLLHKTVPAADIKKYLSGEYAEIGGYVAKADDVAHIKKYDDVVESFRLDYTWDGKRPFPEGGNSYGVIKFSSNYADNVEIPYGKRLGGANTDGPPCTLNGFTGSRNGELVPEWQFNSRYAPNDRAELYGVTDGVEKLLAVYDSDLKVFIPVK
ncbi:hypothetical protein SAMN05421736_11533 [Evansella caseinilytica]|uniref:Uncharacterized protein n=1 Tax=Evansella caseinilytica TaxID=1503961 RepID=A0A1H3TMN6_9BACI|nr:hypothetical protein [Evansella caseinilytica]SDZ50609.1 hypothetical protein SAMN05421736_11533 [Evansella caseinilytica]